MGAVVGMCGPRHRSVKLPWVYVVMWPSSSSEISSHLYSSPRWPNLFAQFQQPLLDLGEVLVGDLVLARIDVVVETVLDGGTDTELHAGIQFLQRLGQQVCRAVPESVLAFRIIPFEQFYPGVSLHRACQVPFLAVDFSSQNVGRKARADALGYL